MDERLKSFRDELEKLLHKFEDQPGTPATYDDLADLTQSVIQYLDHQDQS